MAINNWWQDDASEIYWMEIRTDEDGLGEYLISPKRDDAGKESWSYTLTSFVQPGDRVLHWHRHASEAALTGWSTAVGPLETVPDFSWQARGTKGRERGKPTVGEAWRMPLAGYTPLDNPILRREVLARRNEILDTLDHVEEAVGKPVYKPFVRYGQSELRAAQAYLTKFPAALADLLFAVSPGTALPPRQPRISRGQGYATDAAQRAAVERHAVDAAIAHYTAEGATRIEELGKPYDLRVLIDGQERHVEVKGSVGTGIGSVQVTQNEVEHAAAYQPTDLFVVDEVVVEPRGGAGPSTSGGRTRIWTDWHPAASALRPTHLRYTLPS